MDVARPQPVPAGIQQCRLTAPVNKCTALYAARIRRSHRGTRLSCSPSADGRVDWMRPKYVFDYYTSTTKISTKRTMSMCQVRRPRVPQARWGCERGAPNT